MRRVTLTGSGLWRARLCIGSAVLPRAGSSSVWTKRGLIIHKFLQDVNRFGGAEAGRDKALDLVKDAVLKKVCAAINLERMPVDPAAYVAEVALAYDVVTGRARELHRKGDRDYSMCTPTEIPATLDAAGRIGVERAVIVDYKPGFAFVSDPEINMQFRFGSLAAARAWGCFEATAQMVRLRDDGEPYTIVRHFDSFDLAEIAEEVRELHADATRAASADTEPRLTTGSHCDGCDSIPYCSASTAMIRAAAREPDSIVVGMVDKLTPEHALEAYEQYRALEALVERMKKELDGYAKFNAIPLRDGRVYGVHEKHRDHLNGQKIWHHLERLVGSEEAWTAVKLASKKEDLKELAERIVSRYERAGESVDEFPDDLKNLVRRTLSRSKRKGTKLYKTPLFEALLDDMAEDGALKTSYFEAVEAYKPKEGR